MREITDKFRDLTDPIVLQTTTKNKKETMLQTQVNQGYADSRQTRLLFLDISRVSVHASLSLSGDKVELEIPRIWSHMLAVGQ